MALGILDIGSNTVHLLVIDPAPHALPVPAVDHRTVVPVMEHLDESGAITPDGVRLLESAVDGALAVAREHRVGEVIGMATSALREIPNGPDVLRRLGARAGTDVRVLTGAEESEFTFVAARRWAGWGAGRLLVCDIGGSSLQVAQGSGGLPDQAFSLPLGAGRLTHQFLRRDPAGPDDRRALTEHVRRTLERIATSFASERPDRVLGTSKMLRSLAGLAGHRRGTPGSQGGQVLRLDALADWTERLGRLDPAARLDLPGMTPERARHVLAGAVVATEMMRTLRLDELETCPWALREGVILQFVDPFGGPTDEPAE